MNSFEVMCKVAIREAWSPSGFRCYPCCHELVVRALPLLVRGYVPDTPEWDIAMRLERPEGDQHRLSKLDQDALSLLLSKASPKRIAARDASGRWRDYLAMGVKYTEEIERTTGRLTRAWVPQLLTLAVPGSRAANNLEALQQSLLEGDGRPPRLSPEDILAIAGGE